ncbi:hypothetical protein ACFC1B_30785, partial [Streptomyces xiamenensis]
MTIAPSAPRAESVSGDNTEGPGATLLRTLTELTADLPDTDPGRVAAAALRGRSSAADEAELRGLATESAAGLISEDPAYSKLAARLLTLAVRDEAASQGSTSFSASVEVGHREGLIADRTAEFVRAHASRLDALVEHTLAEGADDRFGFFGLRTLHSRYLLRHPITRQVIEPQVSNLFKRETLSGEFLQVNGYLVEELKALGVWDAQTREALRDSSGSVQGFGWIPAEVRELYR